MKPTITLAAAAVALMAGAVSARAGCADPRNSGAAPLHTIPGFIVSHLNPNKSLPSPPPGHAAQYIVGTWMVTYTSGGKGLGQAFIQWHDDGTEWENINMPVLNGNICVGSWKDVDSLHVYRSHIGWLYTNGALSGYFTETETDKVGQNVYSGVNDTKIFDLQGNVLAEVPGTAHAVRIAP